MLCADPLDESDIINANIPAKYRSANGYWTGLSLRARTIAYSTERVDPAELSTYEALADEAWAGRLCLRSNGRPPSLARRRLDQAVCGPPAAEA